MPHHDSRTPPEKRTESTGLDRRPLAVIRGAWTRRSFIVLPVIVLLCLTLPHLGDGDWMRGDSAWYAAISRQAWSAGERWTLREAPGREYFNKPPMVFWIQGAWMGVFGSSAWSARGASVLAAAIAVGAAAAAAAAAARVGGINRGESEARHVGLVAGLLLAVNIEFFRRTREISLDLWQAALVCLSVACIARAATAAWAPRGDGESRRSPRWLAWFALAGFWLGAALLCKPIVAALTIPLSAAWWIAVAWTDPPRTPSPPSPAPPPLPRARETVSIGLAGFAITTLVAALVAVPWHWSMIMTHGERFTAQYFGREIADRASGQLIGGQRQLQPAWFYVTHIAGAVTFWIAAALMAAAWKPWRCDPAARSGPSGASSASTADESARPPSADARRSQLASWMDAWRSVCVANRATVLLGVIHSLGWFIALSIFPDRRDRYALPIHAGLAIAAAGVLTQGPIARAFLDAHARTIAAFAVVAALVFAALPVRIQRDVHPQWPAFFEWARAEAPRDATGRPMLWDAGFAGAPGARTYLELGAWPAPVRDRTGEITTEPPEGSILLYHRRGGFAPGPNETVVFSRDDLFATRLGPGGVQNSSAADPGE